MDIQLNFVNQSDDANNSNIVIFYKNNGAVASDVAIAWTVIQNCGRGSHHPFTLPVNSAIAYGDSSGNFSAQLPAAPGQRFAAVHTPSGDVIQPSSDAAAPGVIEMVNALPEGPIDVQVYKAGRLFAHRAGVNPAEMASFGFEPTLWIGAVSQIAEGQIMDAAIVSTVQCQLSLLGLTRADIVMTGGGHGSKAKPFMFTVVPHR
jgi:hypothetical protein